MKRAPVIRFRAGKCGTLHNNVNFARHEAECLANDTGKTVPLYQLINGNVGCILQTIKPEKDPS